MRKISFFSLGVRHRQITILIIELLLTISPTYAQDSGKVLLAGTAKIDITPKKPIKMAGYAGRTELSQGVHDPLSVRIIVFENNGGRLVLVSTDLIGFSNGTAEHFRKIILDEFKLEPSELFLSGIHTHAGPSLTIDKEKGHPHNLEYTESLKGTLIEAIRKALDNMCPVHIGVGSGYSPVGDNRRELKFDSLGNSSIILGRNPYGPTDKEVLVMKVTTISPQTCAGVFSPRLSAGVPRPVAGANMPTGGRAKVVAAAFDYATHATCLGAKNYIISGDVLGLAEQFVEKILGEDVIAPAFTGASGDINPWFRVLPTINTEPGWIPEPVLLGTMLGEEVVHIFRNIENIGSPGEIKTSFITLQLPGKPKNEVTVPKDCPPTPLNITVARLGDIAFVGIGCEVLTEIGMAIKAACPYKYTFVITHCNGAAGYLPPKHLYIEGGYEIKSSPFAPQAADMVIKQVVKMLHDIGNW